jgi:integrase
MPEQKTAERINKKIEVAIVDEDRIWKKLRRELRLEKFKVISFSDLADLFFTQYVQNYNRDIRVTKSRLSRLKDFCKTQPIESLGPRSIAAFVAAKRREGVKNATVNRYLALLSKMMNWAIEQEILEVNPFGKIPKLKEDEWVGERPEESKLDEIFGRIDSRILPIFVFLRETGCRVGEGRRLQRAQIDFAGQVVTIHGNTKNGRSRQVPLTKPGLWAVQALPKYGETVFYHPTYLTPFTGDNLGWIWDKARGDSKLRVHDLRHAFAIKLAEDGCPMHYISEILGHHSLEFTRRRYARFSPESASRAVLQVLQGRKTAAKATVGQ